MNFAQKIKEASLGEAPVLTIGLIGDSVTQGCFECFVDAKGNLDTVRDPASSYGTRLEEMLRLLFPRVTFKVINAGISGDSARGGRKRLKKDILSHHPDLVVVGFALNDSTEGREGLAEYKSSLRDIVKRIKEKGAECIVLTPNAMTTSVSPDLKEEPELKFARKFAQLQNDGVLDEYVAAAKEVAAEEGAAVCDVYAKWRELIAAGADVNELLSNKLNHPIRKMHYLTAAMVLDCILK